MSEPINDRIQELITRVLTGEATAEEQQSLQEWMAASPENAAQFATFRKTWLAANDHYIREQLKSVDVNAEWNRFTQAVGGSSERKLNQSSGRSWLRIAAAIVLILGAGAVFFYYANQSSVLTVQTAMQTKEVTLPDGSRVSLNQNSSLSYPEKFGEAREVTLQGEAFFDVERDPQKPFIIHAGEAQVEVLGTSFNVRAYPQQQKIEVVVATGSVKLSVPPLNKEVKLNPGDRGVYAVSSSEVTAATNENANFLSWKTRRIVFEESDLKTVVETLNAVYGANISVAVDVPSTCAVTVTFDNQLLDAVLNVLENTLGLTYRRTGNRIEIVKVGC